MKKVFHPMTNQVLIKVDEAPEVSEGGIILTDASKKKPDSGVVISCGPDVTILEKGDPILFGRYVGVYIQLEKGEFLLLHESDVLGYFAEEQEEV